MYSHILTNGVCGLFPFQVNCLPSVHETWVHPSKVTEQSHGFPTNGLVSCSDFVLISNNISLENDAVDRVMQLSRCAYVFMRVMLEVSLAILYIGRLLPYRKAICQSLNDKETLHRLTRQDACRLQKTNRLWYTEQNGEPSDCQKHLSAATADQRGISKRAVMAICRSGLSPATEERGTGPSNECRKCECRRQTISSVAFGAVAYVATMQHGDGDGRRGA